jgi:hypothetical protein
LQVSLLVEARVVAQASSDGVSGVDVVADFVVFETIAGGIEEVDELARVLVKWAGSGVVQ